jgi:hypothetical protein
MRTVALAHIPSKENRNPPQAIVEPMSQPGALGISSPTAGIEEDSCSQDTSNDSPIDHSVSLTTNADSFDVYRVYARKPVHYLSQCSNPDPHCDNQSSSSDSRPGTAPNQGPPHLDMQTKPYYHPFSNPSAAAMMVIHHLGTSTRSIQQTNEMANIMVGLDTDFSLSNLGKFNAAVEYRQLDAYLSSMSGSTFQHEDGWLESLV